MVDVTDSEWIEKTEHYKALSEKDAEIARERRLREIDRATYDENSSFIHKEDIEWLLIKERGEIMLVTFIITSAFWACASALLYLILA